MVFFYECSNPTYKVYMGRDKHENEELIKYSWPEDIWFHVDKYSSAHVYLRLPVGSVPLAGVKDKAAAKEILMAALASVPEDVCMEMCQLTKNNSIDGCKAASVDIVYTPALNLKKEERMDVGQVGFKDESFRLLKKDIEKDKDIVKKIEKSKEERKVDLCAERQQRDEEERIKKKKQNALNAEKEKQEAKQHAIEKEQRSYSSLQVLDKESNKDVKVCNTTQECQAAEEDFM
jgi:hypothetical protein